MVNDTNGVATNSTADLLRYLGTGSNLIAIHASDNYLRFGYLHGLCMELDGNYASPRPPPTTDVPDPATLRLFAIGSLAAGLSRRRRTR